MREGLTVAEAQQVVLEAAGVLGAETVSAWAAAGRVLAEPIRATRRHPPADCSAMDGYAVRRADLAGAGPARPIALPVVFEVAAGGQALRRIEGGEAARIFTGAPMPAGADAVVIQEDVTAGDGHITVLPSLDAGAGTRAGSRTGTHVRPKGADFAPGDRLAAPRRLGPAELSLIAAMNLPTVSVARRPEVALIGTGDELVMPGEAAGPDQIVASNLFGLRAIVAAAGGVPRLLPVARDTEASLRAVFALADGADLIVTVGGASVGDHDLVAQVARGLGVEMAFHKVALRPGKPLMSGRLGGAALLGLPGNPVSALVCATLFLAPMIRAMQGDPAPLPRHRRAQLATALGANGPRAHYMRARLDGEVIAPFERQDSALLTVLAEADALLVRPVADPPRQAGESVDYIAI